MPEYLKIKFEGLEELRKVFNKKELNTIMVRTLNDAAKQTKSFLVKKIRERYAIKASYLRERAFSIKKATPSRLYAVLVAKGGKGVSLMHYPVRQTKKGVSAQVLRGRRVLIPHAFIQHVGGRPHVFIRKIVGGRRVGRYPVQRLLGPGMTTFIQHPEIWNAAHKKAEEFMIKNLGRRIDWMLAKIR